MRSGVSFGLFVNMAKDKAPKSDEAQSAETVIVASMADALEDYEGFIQARASSIWSYSELPFDLNTEEQLFVRSYVIDRNEVAAMRRLGYTDDQKKLKARSKRHLLKLEVQEAIEYLAKQMMDRLEVTAEKVQRQMAAIAFFDPRQILEFDKYGVNLVHSRFWTEEQAAALQSVKMGQNGIEVKFYDRLRATEMLAKQVGLDNSESDAATQARLAADETMERIATIMARALPGAKRVIDQRMHNLRTKTIEHQPEEN